MTKKKLCALDGGAYRLICIVDSGAQNWLRFR